MSNRVLLIVSLVVALFAVWFYRNQGDVNAPLMMSKNNIKYQATDILVVQTNAQGIAEYSLTADDLIHYVDKNLDHLQGMTLNWQPNRQLNLENNIKKYEKNEKNEKNEQMNQVDSAGNSRANHIVITSDDALMYQDNKKVVMKNNVVFVSQNANKNEPESLSNPIKPPMRLTANELIGDLNQKLIYSNQPIQVTQANNKFNSKSFKADIETGEYEFAQVAVTFVPPERKNTPLF